MRLEQDVIRDSFVTETIGRAQARQIDIACHGTCVASVECWFRRPSHVADSTCHWCGRPTCWEHAVEIAYATHLCDECDAASRQPPSQPHPQASQGGPDNAGLRHDAQPPRGGSRVAGGLVEDHDEDDGRIEGACAQLPLDAARGNQSESPEPPGRRAVACPGGPWVSGPGHSRASSQEEDVETPTGRATEDVAPDHRKDLARRRRDETDEQQTDIRHHGSCDEQRHGHCVDAMDAMVECWMRRPSHCADSTCCWCARPTCWEHSYVVDDGSRWCWECDQYRVPPQPLPVPVDGHTDSSAVKYATDNEIKVQIPVSE